MLEINNQNKHQIIEKYFKNELDATSKNIFKEKYDKDADFKEEVDQYEMIVVSFQNLSDDATQRIEGILQKQTSQPEEQTTKVIPLWRKKSFWAVAASVAVVMVAGIVFFLNDDQSNLYTAEGEILNSFSLGIEPGNNLGFSDQPRQVTDSVQVVVIEDGNWNQHYQYVNDTLKLFLDKNVLQGDISLKQNEQDYLLQIDEDTYLIDQGFDRIKPLSKL